MVDSPFKFSMMNAYERMQDKGIINSGGTNYNSTHQSNHNLGGISNNLGVGGFGSRSMMNHTMRNSSTAI